MGEPHAPAHRLDILRMTTPQCHFEHECDPNRIKRIQYLNVSELGTLLCKSGLVHSLVMDECGIDNVVSADRAAQAYRAPSPHR